MARFDRKMSHSVKFRRMARREFCRTKRTHMERSFYTRAVGLTTIASGLLAAACLVVGVLAVDGDMDAFADPLRTLQHAQNHRLAYWFNILDLFGYYLLLVPVILHLHSLYRFRSPWVPLFTFSGLAYALIGAVGAVVLAVLWPELMQQHLVAAPDERPMIELVFKASTVAVVDGLWNILEVLFAGVWWIGIGLLLRSASAFAGYGAIVAGVACVLDAKGNMIGWPLLSEIGLNIYLLMGIVWPIIIGVWLMRRAANGAGHEHALAQ